ATAILAAKAQHAGQATKTLSEWPLSGRIVQSFYGLWFYVLKSIAPSNLSPLYQLPPDVHPFEPRYLVAYAFVAAATFAVVFAWIRRPDAPAVPVAAAVYLVMLAPVLGLLQSGEQMVADRYSYIAAMPLAMLVGAGGLLLYQRLRGASGDPARAGPLLGTMGAVAVLSLGALTYA